MLEFIKAFILGIVEGITEWLPVSSTGHIILVDRVLHLNVSEEFGSLFDVVIQLGAILAVIILFWNTIWPLKTENKKIKFKTGTLILYIKLIIACLPAVVFALLGFDDKCEELFYKPVPIAVALIAVGVLFIIVENINKKKSHNDEPVENVSYIKSFFVGIFQLIAAVFPGTSRSGITIVGGLSMGLSRKTAAEFTFILSVPVMLGASMLKVYKYLKTGLIPTTNEMVILFIGFISAFIVSLFIIKALMAFIKKHDFKPFAYYRIALGILVLLLTYFSIV